MATPTREPSSTDTDTASADRPGRGAGVALMLGSALSSQSGAAIGALAFPVIGPVGVVAVRQWVAGLVMLAVGRPRLRAFTRREWWPVLGLAGVFATMNVSLYTAIDRIGLGLAVTLEFLGPLGVALLGARTATPAGPRRRVTLGCAVLAGAGVVLLTRPRPSTDYLGVGLGLLAALCWASYILLNRTLGRRLPGVQGSAAAGAASGLVYLPVGIAVLIAHPPTPAALACAVSAGLLASVVPFLSDLLALRRVPAHSFGIFMSASPVLAAAIGALVLGQALAALDWLAVGLIVTANTAAVLVTRPPRRTIAGRPQTFL
ncbi:EamA family transporter [Pseudonocardia humida]|uniref:EamA family transporter n=1 Tax=Pseudonocardia humida TaxID=2800819 RepID=A0ABT1A1Z7_9PSEU|nr:EamA family transporter [Pseudonocardia humida]MCO1657008.1 EamA family transporter [Pseudonocardia humida]